MITLKYGPSYAITVPAGKTVGELIAVAIAAWAIEGALQAFSASGAACPGDAIPNSGDVLNLRNVESPKKGG